MSNRQWIDEVFDTISAYKYSLGGSIDKRQVDRAKATINQKINQEFEDLLESLPKNMSQEVAAFKHGWVDSEDLAYNLAMSEARRLIKDKIKDKNGNS